MTAHALTQLALPIVLALMMLGMGLQLSLHHFKQVLFHPYSIVLGVILQMVTLPLLAWTTVIVFDLQGLTAAGLILVSLCPGGASSNLISHLSKGNTALSITLTSVVSLVTPFTIPLAANLSFGWLGLDMQQFSLPVLPTIMKLAVITLIPVFIGMMAKHYFSRQAEQIGQLLNRLSMLALILLVATIYWINRDKLPDLLSIVSLSCLTLTLIAMASGFTISKACGLSHREARTMAVETGIQNAGVAMLIAVTILNNPVLAIVPMTYGILMNIPAFSLVAWMNRRGATGRGVTDSDRVDNPLTPNKV